MPSTPSASLLVELQAAGENLNTWGDTRLNNGLSMLEAGSHAISTHALTANKSLTYTNYILTDGSRFVQKITSTTDGSYTLTLGGYARSYLIWNDSSHDQTIACSGGGTSQTVEAGRIKQIYCDATNVIQTEDGLDLETGDGRYVKLAGSTITGPILYDAAAGGATELVNKGYVDGLAFQAVDLPGITPATAGFYLTNDGATANWGELDSDLTAIAALSTTAQGRSNLIENPRHVTNSDSPVTAADGDVIICDTSPDTITINFPAAAANAKIRVKAGASASTNNVTVSPDGSDTILGETSLEIDTNFFDYEFVGNNGGWD
ncbi:MAG: hypothetical protein AAGA08_16885 [Pseudomonadota bacterium]